MSSFLKIYLEFNTFFIFLWFNSPMALYFNEQIPKSLEQPTMLTMIYILPPSSPLWPYSLLLSSPLLLLQPHGLSCWAESIPGILLLEASALTASSSWDVLPPSYPMANFLAFFKYLLPYHLFISGSSYLYLQSPFIPTPALILSYLLISCFHVTF